MTNTAGKSATIGHVFVEEDEADIILVIIMVVMMTILKITMVVIMMVMMVMMVMKKIGHLQSHVGPDKVTSPNT